MSATATIGSFQDNLLSWLNRKFAPAGRLIEAETPLFKGGLIDSIRILELIAWTERETGSVIPDRMILMDNFRTARRVTEVFAPEEDDAVL
jgi:acyl carrier protein